MTEDVHRTDATPASSHTQKENDSHDWNQGNSDLPVGIEGNPVKADDEKTGDDITYENATGSGEMEGGGADG